MSSGVPGLESLFCLVDNVFYLKPSGFHEVIELSFLSVGPPCPHFTPLHVFGIVEAGGKIPLKL